MESTVGKEKAIVFTLAFRHGLPGRHHILTILYFHFSVRRLVCPLVRPPVRPFVRPSVRSFVVKHKNILQGASSRPDSPPCFLEKLTDK